LARSIITMIAKVQHPIARDAYVRIASQTLGIPEAQLFGELRALQKSTQKRPRRPSQPVQEEKRAVASDVERQVFEDPFPEELKLIRIMLTKGVHLTDLILRCMSLEEFTEGPSRETVGHLVQMRQEDRYDVHPFLDDSFGEVIRDFVAGALTSKQSPSQGWADREKGDIEGMDHDAERSAVSAMILLKSDLVKKLIEEARQHVRLAQEKGEDDKELIKKLNDLNEIKMSIRDPQNYS